KVIYGYIIVIVEKQSQDIRVDQSHKDFIAHFYSLAFVAIIFDWINNDMKDDPKEIVDQISVLITGDFQKALQNYAK
ncbi:TetR-like C-terminal domain-containing protein, partial [Companilactobacillus halodurans]|uniref:TetR-like C-terminal domain-containing protein n=2 Tax=Companilactobacillus TaxID=2767879 RepID=UPI001864BDAD